ncbi:MAG: phage major capsid protein [Pseudonocardiaceae bacterium]|nr:phage major capsid protein [Pseudonocardiaceae bacterium]
MNHELLHAQYQQHLQAAKSIARTADDAGRDFTDTERETAQWHMDEAKRLRPQMEKARDDEAAAASARELGEALGAPDAAAPSGDRRVTATGGTTWAKHVVRANSDAMGQFKALMPSGAVPVTVPVNTEPVREAEPILSLRQLIPTQADNVGRWAYLRQTVRTSNAAPVAPGERKPTSIFSLEKVEDRTHTIAHLSEPIARQDLDDAPLLERFVDTELRLGLETALEDQILTGDGTGENLTGLANVSGIQLQAHTTDLLTTTRKAITLLEVLRLTGTGFVFTPADWEAIELEAAEQYAANPRTRAPVDRAARRLWSLPVALSTTVPVGTGYLADFAGSTQLRVREDARIDWSENIYDPDRFGAGDGGSLFEANQIVFRCEGRFGFAVTRPAGVVSIDLTAA